MKDLKQRQCKNLSIQDIADILDADVEIAAMILNILDRQGIIETESHVYCHECSADNVISCDGFYEIPVICYKCGKQISITDMEKGGIKRYGIDLKGLEEFVRRDYYEVYYDNCNYENTILYRKTLTSFNENIDKYNKEHGQEERNMEENRKMIFISHSEKDKEFVAAFIELLEGIGLNEDEVVCSSIPPYCIPIDGKVYKWLVDKFQNCELHVFYMLSDNYYKSVACLNEMGAAWALKQKWSTILLPGFDFDEIKGCIDSTQIGIKLDDKDMDTLKYRLGEMKDNLICEFGLREISHTLWERKRDSFLKKVNEIIQEKDIKDTKVNYK